MRTRSPGRADPNALPNPSEYWMRRSVTLGLAAAFLSLSGAVAQQVPIGEGSIVETVAGLRAGQYVWAPEVAPSGPLLLIVNLATQRAILFRNGVPIAASTVSTGRPGYETPAGIFTILQKRVEHYSSTYDNAPMPYMQRLTWRGVALHAGQLPGYPASHGCIRLPAGFAKLLFGVTRVGMTVVITRHAVTPRVAPTPELALSPPTGVRASDAMEWHPEKSPQGPVSILVSAADRRAVILRNGVEIGSATVTVDGPVTATRAFALKGIDAAGQHWVSLDLGPGPVEEARVPTTEWRRFHAPDSFRRAVAGIVAPGTTIILTPDSLRAGGEAIDLIDAESPEAD